MQRQAFKRRYGCRHRLPHSLNTETGTEQGVAVVLIVGENAHKVPPPMAELLPRTNGFIPSTVPFASHPRCPNDYTASLYVFRSTVCCNRAVCEERKPWHKKSSLMLRDWMSRHVRRICEEGKCNLTVLSFSMAFPSNPTTSADGTCLFRLKYHSSRHLLSYHPSNFSRSHPTQSLGQLRICRIF